MDSGTASTGACKSAPNVPSVCYHHWRLYHATTPPPLYLTCSRGQSGMGDLCGLDLGGVYSELASSTGGGGSSTRSTVTAPMSGCSTGGG